MISDCMVFENTGRQWFKHERSVVCLRLRLHLGRGEPRVLGYLSRPPLVHT